MEMQFDSGRCSFLRCNVREIQNLEQTLELRLTDQMPDIDRVLCAWGQVLVRSKEWLSDSVRITGGVNAWVLYVPEGETAPQCVEGWLPFQTKWLLPDGHKEGSIRTSALLRAIDARSLSARKMMVRASVGVLAEMLEPAEVDIFTPGELPADVPLLQRRYPACLMRETGEKQFSLEEEFNLAVERPARLLCCRAQPVVSERAVAGSRVVMRGMVWLQYVYLNEDGRVCSGSQEIPFAQFGELDKDYDKEAFVDIMPMLTNLESNLVEDRLQIKCGIVAQYVIYDRVMLDMAEDVYSLHRKVSPTVTQLELPAQLDATVQTMDAQAEFPAQVQSLVDVAFRPDHPVHYCQEDGICMEIPGSFQMLYYDLDGNLQSGVTTWSGQQAIPAGENCQFRISLTQPNPPSGAAYGDRIRVNGDIALDVSTGTTESIPMITALELGDTVQPDPMRPSVIVRRAGELGLWDLAKKCGSTVDAITQANQLTDEPEPDRMLLIPVL